MNVGSAVAALALLTAPAAIVARRFGKLRRSWAPIACVAWLVGTLILPEVKLLWYITGYGGLLAAIGAIVGRLFGRFRHQWQMACLVGVLYFMFFTTISPVVSLTVYTVGLLTIVAIPIVNRARDKSDEAWQPPVWIGVLYCVLAIVMGAIILYLPADTTRTAPTIGNDTADLIKLLWFLAALTVIFTVVGALCRLTGKPDGIWQDRKLWLTWIITSGSLAVGFGGVGGYIAVSDPALTEPAVKCTATILDLEDDGATKSGHWYKVTAAVTGPKGTITATESVRIDPVTAGQIGAGRTKFDCLQLASDPRRFEIQWDPDIPK